MCKTMTEESEASVAVAEQWGGGASISHVYCTIYYIHTSDEHELLSLSCII